MSSRLVSFYSLFQYHPLNWNKLQIRPNHPPLTRCSLYTTRSIHQYNSTKAQSGHTELVVQHLLASLKIQQLRHHHTQYAWYEERFLKNIVTYLSSIECLKLQCPDAKACIGRSVLALHHEEHGEQTDFRLSDSISKD